MQSKLMKQSAAILLLVLGFLSAVIAARHVASPGYMDADYYYSMGIQWANGKGNEEPFLWNYLNDPTEIPTPSHAYWSPLTSIISGIALDFAQPSCLSSYLRRSYPSLSGDLR